MIKIYTLENCPRCDEIKTKIVTCGYEYEECDMGSAESLTDMKMGNCFAQEAPVVECDGIFYEYCHCNADGFFTDLIGMCDTHHELPEISETHQKVNVTT